MDFPPLTARDLTVLNMARLGTRLSAELGMVCSVVEEAGSSDDIGGLLP